MRDLQAWLPQPNGILGDYNPPPSPLSHQPNPHPSEIRVDSWQKAEEATQEVIENIQPTVVSEQRRKAVVEYVQKLIRGFIGSEVFPFGSVPLKTYLPDGDIDLTALGIPNSEDALASDVCSVLEIEEQSKDAEFEVKDVQYIHAEVKLVKCLVQNIVVDISFNQIGGLCTLCFLEQVDRLIGKDHLFKRSIILIKAWCYYESRILGAHHGLISTYALETLVLYIFHLFHSSLDGPLAVLYRFLDYYSKFDWDNYCISLNGPVSVSSLPELVAEAPENDGGDLLLTKEFLNNCLDMFSFPPRGFESNSRVFPQKHLNIVDPLKENNNLGRSVSRGNFYRIRSAFTYGARKLGRILLLPSESIADEVSMFFTNTLDRHGSGERPDVQDALPICPESSSINPNGIGSMLSELKLEMGRKDKSNLGTQATDPHGVLCEEINSTKISGLEKENSSREESDSLVESRCLVGDARDLATGRASGSSNSRERSKASPSTSERGNSPSGKAYHAPHLFFHPENGHQNGGLDQTNPANVGTANSLPSTRPLPLNEEVSLFIQPDSFETESSSSTSWFSNHGSLSLSWNAYPSENLHPGECSSAGAEGNGANGSSKSNKLSDLSGDYNMHLRSLLYAQWCQEYIMGTLFLPVHQSPRYQYHNKHSWDPLRQHSVFTHMNANGVAPGPPFSPPGSYPITQPFVTGAFGVEDLLKPRGTGTYFPNTNYRTYRERHSPGRGKNTATANHLPRQRNNSRADAPQDANLQEKGSQEPPPSQLKLPVFSGNGRGKPALLNIPLSPRPALKGTSPTNGFVFPPEGRLEFGSVGPVQLKTSPIEPGRRSDSVSPRTQGSGSVIPASTWQRPAMSSNRERSAQSYQLKDEGDFPPLTG